MTSAAYIVCSVVCDLSIICLQLVCDMLKNVEILVRELVLSMFYA